MSLPMSTRRAGSASFCNGAGIGCAVSAALATSTSKSASSASPVLDIGRRPALKLRRYLGRIDRRPIALQLVEYPRVVQPRTKPHLPHHDEHEHHLGASAPPLRCLRRSAVSRDRSGRAPRPRRRASAAATRKNRQVLVEHLLDLLRRREPRPRRGMFSVGMASQRPLRDTIVGPVACASMISAADAIVLVLPRLSVRCVLARSLTRNTTAGECVRDVGRLRVDVGAPRVGEPIAEPGLPHVAAQLELADRQHALGGPARAARAPHMRVLRDRVQVAADGDLEREAGHASPQRERPDPALGIVSARVALDGQAFADRRRTCRPWRARQAPPCARSPRCPA